MEMESEICYSVLNIYGNVTGDILQRIWQEFNYRLDVCRVTDGTHIEFL